MKRILIIFPDPHLPYSPTILNLYQSLKDHFHVTILNFENRQFKKIKNPDIKYLQIPFLQKKFHGIVNKFSIGFGQVIMAHIKRKLVRRFIKDYAFDQYIVTDLIGLWFVKGLPLHPVHLVSLELTFNTIYFKSRVDVSQLASILVQSPERLDFVAQNFPHPVFFLQNAPVFQYDLVKNKIEPERNHFIFSGTASARFGIFQCLDFLMLYKEFSMTLIGNIPEVERDIIQNKYNLLIKENRLKIETRYYSTSEMLVEVGKYRIGFCFYDFSFPEINNVNYRTAPSGKMFTYFAAGVPVIGINIPGLNPVKEFNAGLLIEELSPETIALAIQSIEEDYEAKVHGCYKAATFFSFDTRVKPFIGFVKQVGV